MLLTITIDDGYSLIGFDTAALNPANSDNTNIGVVIQRGNTHLEWAVHVHLRRADLIHNGLKQGCHITFTNGVFRTGITVQCGGVDHREVQLLITGTQLVEQFKSLVQYPVRASTVTVNLVDDNDRPKTHLKRFLGYKPGLWHRAVDCIHQQ